MRKINFVGSHCLKAFTVIIVLMIREWKTLYLITPFTHLNIYFPKGLPKATGILLAELTNYVLCSSKFARVSDSDVSQMTFYYELLFLSKVILALRYHNIQLTLWHFPISAATSQQTHRSTNQYFIHSFSFVAFKWTISLKKNTKSLFLNINLR